MREGRLPELGWCDCDWVQFWAAFRSKPAVNCLPCVVLRLALARSQGHDGAWYGPDRASMNKVFKELGMASVNKVILMGNLGRDPEVRYSPDGAAVCNVSIATTSSWKDKNSGERREETEWHRVVFYNRLAEIAGEYLKKGRPVYVEGRIKTRKWQNKEGVDQFTTEVVADNMQLLGGRDGGDGGSSGGNEGGSSAPRPAARAQQAARPAAPAAGGANLSDMDDDIPF